MADAPQTISHVPSSIHDDVEGLPSVPGKKRSPLSVFFRPIYLACRYPFLSAILIYAGVAFSILGAAYWSYRRDMENMASLIPPSGDGIALGGYGAHFDLTSETFSIDWEIAGCGIYQQTALSPISDLSYAGCGILNQSVDIYFNYASEPTYSYDPAKFPRVFGGMPGGLEILNVFRLGAFKMDHGIDYVSPGPDVVPFDVYTLTILAFAIDKATNRSVPIVTFIAGGKADNFVISSNTVRALSLYTYDNGTGPTEVEVDSSVINIEAKRSLLARAYMICLLAVNWALTVGSVYITLLVIFRRDNLDESVLLLPVTIILTIPTLRDLYVGSPPFGIFIDTFGIFLQMVTVAICSMVLVYFVTIQKSRAVPERRSSHDNGSTQPLGTKL